MCLSNTVSMLFSLLFKCFVIVIKFILICQFPGAYLGVFGLILLREWGEMNPALKLADLCTFAALGGFSTNEKTGFIIPHSDLS